MSEHIRRAIRRDIVNHVDSEVPDLLADGNPADALGVSEVYRGEPVEALNLDEFSNNAIDGTPFDVWDYEPTDDPDESPNFKEPDDWPGEILDHYKVNVTGGLTMNIGAAFHFQKPAPGDLGLTLILDSSKIMGEVKPIEYALPWFDRNPGVMARVETLADGEVRVDGELMGLVDTNPGDGYRVVNKWGRERMEGRATNPTYVDEAEAVALAPEIGLDGALKHAVGHYHRQAALGGGLQSTLQEQDGYGGFAADRRPADADDRTMTEWVYEETVEKADLGEEYIKLVITNDRMSTEDKKISRDNFAWAYDGTVFMDDYDDAAHLLGRTHR